MTSNYNNITLLRTKLHRPPVSNDFVLRAELTTGLEKDRQLPFTLVSAGAVTLLVGKVRDQAELNGILDLLYSLQRPVLSVECLEKL